MRFATCMLAGLVLAPLATAGAATDADALRRHLSQVDPAALLRAAQHRAERHPDRFPPAALADATNRLAALGTRLPDLRKALDAGAADAAAEAESVLRFRRDLLLSDPALDTFRQVLFIRRAASDHALGLPANWESNSSLPPKGWHNSLCLLEWRADGAEPEVVFAPPDGGFIGDVRLDFDASRILFSSPGANGRWQVHEMGLADRRPRELPLILEPDVDNYDACHLPDGNLLFTSTAPFTGVPCVRGGSHVSNLYRYDRDTGGIRRLTVDQDHNWGPVVLDNGRVMYLRWEYTDIPHFASRILFTMNPDGTAQMEHYGSNSYWPNSIFYAQPVPGHPTKFAGIVTGHHGVRRMGELVIFDPALGRREAAGVVQRIPGWSRPVEPVILDHLVDASWPKFLHPCPIDEEHLLVSMQPDPKSPWGLYLVDVFDNLVPLREEPGQALLEPVALRPRPRPPVVPSRVKEGETAATLYIENIYAGPGLSGVPAGTVKALRLITYSFAYQGMGGQIDRVGLDGPWDPKRVLGTVPVEPDGSALFAVPANTPVSIQPLDADGRALALMRSWTTAMPGEVQSCVGCHETQNSAPTGRGNTIAARRPPSALQPWHGPVRGFDFNREVQPVLDRHCVGCHAGQAGHAAPDLSRRPPAPLDAKDPGYTKPVPFPPSYVALRSFVRAPTIESDLHLLTPAEFHASTTELVQLLERGHHGVALDAESWDRLHTWIDLNTPAYGTWTEIAGSNRVARQAARRREMNRRYANLDIDEEWIPPASSPPAFQHPISNIQHRTSPIQHPASNIVPQPPAPTAESLRLDLGGGAFLDLVRVPAGTFTAGGDGVWERPGRAAKIEKAFWMGKLEVTNEQFGKFDPTHDSRLEHGDFLQFSVKERGWALNAAAQPACRVSWDRARAFCRWLSERSGRRIDLPTDDQWEWACRAGGAGPFWFGGVDADFSKQANLADAAFKSVETLGWNLPSGAIPSWRPAADAFNDGHRVSAPAGSYAANPWGLHDLHGNVWEWVLDDAPTPEGAAGAARKVARGGSWSDRPARATAAAWIAYPPWQRVHNVGFRVVCGE